MSEQPEQLTGWPAVLILALATVFALASLAVPIVILLRMEP